MTRITRAKIDGKMTRKKFTKKMTKKNHEKFDEKKIIMFQQNNLKTIPQLE